MNSEPKLQEMGEKLQPNAGLPLKILNMGKLLSGKDVTTELVALWVAEGLVPLGDDQEWPPELVVETYLTELIDLDMVQIAKRKPNGKIKTCRVPDGLRQIFKSTESRIPELQVLDLEGVYKPKLPKDIAKLSGLRYLGLRWTYLESLPSSISSLLQLQTLDLKHTYIQTLPSSIWKMKLRHLFLSESNRTRFPSKPIGIDIGRSLHDHQTLWGVFVDEETPVKSGLDKLVNITKLGITGQSQKLEQLEEWKIEQKSLSSLRQLEIRICPRMKVLPDGLNHVNSLLELVEVEKHVNGN
ncbi:leucine-rich repeat-containing protein 40-like [Vigna unguiculata]|uniref:leucine-rich repeat-containing protein 40-like n=1 Tax=Vigna unguiculata TaxID=3917 RepID=UPI00101678E9|nr:leucine-rich repeat-containing protein 40-like [Vigna unguiculata]